MSYHLFIVACAGAGATVIALVSTGPPLPCRHYSNRFAFQPTSLGLDLGSVSPV